MLCRMLAKGCNVALLGGAMARSKDAHRSEPGWREAGAQNKQLCWPLPCPPEVGL